MYWLNLDSVPLHVSSLFAAIPNYHEAPATRKFPAFTVKSPNNQNNPWYPVPMMRDSNSSLPVISRLLEVRANLAYNIKSHNLRINPPINIDANGVTYTRKGALTGANSTVNYTGDYVSFFKSDDDSWGKFAIFPGQSGDQYDFKTTIGGEAITYGEPTFISRMRHHLADLYRPYHFFTTEGDPIDVTGAPRYDSNGRILPDTSSFTQLYGNWVNAPNSNAFPSWSNAQASSTARLDKTVSIGSYDAIFSQGSPYPTTRVGVVEYDPPTLNWNGVTIQTSSLIQRGVGYVESTTTGTVVVGPTTYYTLKIVDSTKFWSNNELLNRLFYINPYTGSQLIYGNDLEVNGVSSNDGSSVTLSSVSPFPSVSNGSTYLSLDNQKLVTHRTAENYNFTNFHEQFKPFWAYYNDQHASNMLITSYVALTGDYMVEDDFENLANMELGLYKPWTGVWSNVLAGFGHYPGGGEREYGRRLLFWTNPMCITKPSVARKFHEMAKAATDRIENKFRDETANYTLYDRTCLQIGSDGGRSTRNPIYLPWTSGTGGNQGATPPVNIWLPWQMTYIIRGLYAFTKFNNDSKYRDLLLRFCRTLFVHGVFKEASGLLPTRPGAAGQIAHAANRLYPNYWKTVANMRTTGNYTPIDSSSYYETDWLRLPDQGLSYVKRDARWRTGEDGQIPGFNRPGGSNWKGDSPWDVSCGLSGDTVVSGISTGASGTILTDFNREVMVDNGYFEWHYAAAQIAATIIRDSDEAGDRQLPFSGVIQARENARQFLDFAFKVNPNDLWSGNQKYGRAISKWSPTTLLWFACYTPFALTDQNQYPLFSPPQDKRLGNSLGTEGAGGNTGNNSFQPTPPNGGWTNFVSSVDSRIVYVSYSSGNDSNNGLSPATPKKTIAAGYELLRDGYPDWLLLSRGDTFNFNGQGLSGLSTTGNRNIWHKSGRSNEERMLFGAYGDESLARPIIKIYNRVPFASKYADPYNPQYGNDSSFTRNLNFVSLDFTSEFYPNFSGQGLDSNTGNEYLALDFTNGIRNLLIEDCSFHDLNFGLVIQNFSQSPALIPAQTPTNYTPDLPVVNIESLNGILALALKDPNSDALSFFSKNVKVYRSSFYNIQVSGSNRSTRDNRVRIQSIYANAVLDLVIEECVFDELMYSERIPNILANIYSHHLYLDDFAINPIVAKSILSRASSQGAKMANGGFCARNLFMRNLIAGIQGACGNIAQYGTNFTDVCPQWVARQRCNFYANVSMDNRDLRYPSGVEPFTGETRVDGGLRETYGWHFNVNGGETTQVYDNIMIGSNTSGALYRLNSGVGLSVGGSPQEPWATKNCYVVNNIFYNISGTLGDAISMGFNLLTSSNNVNIIGNISQFSSAPATVNNLRPVLLLRGTRSIGGGPRSGGNIFQVNKISTSFVPSNETSPTNLSNWWSIINDNGSRIGTTTFPDPSRTIETYQATIEAPTGGLDAYNFFMKKARENRKGAWSVDYTANAVIDYIREGFGKPKFF
jgi:hypothetical protein